METTGLLQRRPRVHASLACATISIAQKALPQASCCEYRLPKVAAVGPAGDGPRIGLQYRRAKTASSSDQYADLRHARKLAASAGSGLERGHVRRSAVSLSGGDARDPQSHRRRLSGPESAGDQPAPLDTPIAHRTLEERLANPDRLSLDRRGLTSCPRLEGEENLRLLNLQHNLITQVRNLVVLRKLIFLDLYDNRIERMSGLSCLRSLRVLMLGKNRISSIEGLEALEKLDVLDLHGNEIEEITNLSHLKELRVLNLAGNRIRAVRGLAGMRSLTELNLRRNHIELVEEVDQLPMLERIFLSHNDIISWAQIDAVTRSDSITELTLDGNLLSREMHYRFAAIHQLAQVRSLDMKRISDEERRLALAWSRREEEKKKEMSRIATIKESEKNCNLIEKRRQALCQAKKQWEMSHASLWNRTGRVMRIPDLYTMHMSRTTPGSNDEGGDQPSEDMATVSHSLQDPTITDVTSQRSWSRTQARTAVESVFADLSKISVSQSQNQPVLSGNVTDSGFESSDKTNQSSEMEFDEVDGGAFISEESLETAGSAGHLHVAEVVGSDLILYGPGAFPAMDSLYVKEIGNTITGIVFKYIPFEDVIKNFPKLRAKYPHVTSLTFMSTSIATYAQLGMLSQIRRIDNVSISSAGNPVTELQHWRSFLLMRMAHTNIRKINGTEVTEEDWELARSVFHVLAVGDPRSCDLGGAHPRPEQQQRLAGELVGAWADTCLRADHNRTKFGRLWPCLWRAMVLDAREAVRRRQREAADAAPT